MLIFDTHCHYNLEPLHEAWQDHWKLAQRNSVTHSVVVGTEYTSSQVALQIAAQEPNLFASIGYHPGYFTEHADDYLTGQTVHDTTIEATLTQTAAHMEKLVAEKPLAIGEIGLDYFRLKSKGLKRSTIVDIQKQTFLHQLTLAHDHHLPVILHVRDQDDRTSNTAYQDVLSILKENTPKKFVLHCASGPLEYIREALEIGAYVGFDGNITYDSAGHLREIFALTPPERRLLETDAPYLAPGLHKGRDCEPWMVTETAHFIQDELGADLEQIYENSFLFFDSSKNDIQ